MPLIIIRHGDDENGRCSKADDCQLVKGADRQATKVGHRLIEKYGLPNKIYVSPFRRTLQTMRAMTQGYSLTDCEIIEDPRLSRYFTSKQKKNPRVDKQTIEKGIPIYETYSQFKKRVSNVISDVTTQTKKDEVVWVITHTLVYKRFARYFDVDIPSHIPFMHNFRGSYCNECKVYH